MTTRSQLTTNVILGKCQEVLPQLPSQSFDAVFTDPPYPGAVKAYGKFGEAEWLEMMQTVVKECRRLLAPHGSAVFVLQPNSQQVGQMRPWLWDFLAWCCREWNVVQDVYWWNFTAPPTVHARQSVGLTRPSLKMCVWLGPADCYRHQAAVLLDESDSARTRRLHSRFRVGRENRASRYSFNDQNALSLAGVRGGTTPFNVLPIPNCNPVTSGGALGHAAATPAELCEWWLRYIVPGADISSASASANEREGAVVEREGAGDGNQAAALANTESEGAPGLGEEQKQKKSTIRPRRAVLDPFAGSGTTLAVAARLGLAATGIESAPNYVELIRTRLGLSQPDPDHQPPAEAEAGAGGEAGRRYYYYHTASPSTVTPTAESFDLEKAS
jgi:hypothetical protein